MAATEDTKKEAAPPAERNARADEHLDAAQTGRLIHEGDEGAAKLVAQAAHDPKAATALSDGEKVDALSWLLADDDEGEDTRVETWQFNIGTEEMPEWIDWTIRPVDADTMNAMRQRVRGNRTQRRARGGSGEADFDVQQFNLMMVVAATVEPNLQEAATAKNVATADPFDGPVVLLKHRFRNKPGIVDQIAQKVMLFSGYDEDDARRATTPEAVMVRAAKNS